MEQLHHLNILVHVMAGLCAMITGIIALLVRKERGRHTTLGGYFRYMMIVVITTALAGVFVFDRNGFLLMITLLGGYNCYSGIRVLRRYGQRPVWLDYVVPVIVMASAVYYVSYLQQHGMYWAPVITYSTIGSLFMVCIYDMLRGVMQVQTLKKAAMYEHTYKMMSALAALLSAFGGTVLPQCKPYSQFMPSMIALSITIIIFIRLSKRQLSFQRKRALQMN